MEYITNDFLMILECFSFFYIIFRVNFRNKTVGRTSAIIICLAIWIISRMLGINLNDWIIFPFSIYIIAVYFVLYQKISEMFVLGIAEWLLLCMLEMPIRVILIQFNIEEQVAENIIVLLILGFLWLYYFTIGRKTESATFRLPIKIWCLLDIVMFILTAMMEYFSYEIVMENPTGSSISIGGTLSAFGGILIYLLILVMIYYYNRTNNYRMQKELAEIQNEQQREYFLQLLKREEETRAFRHDIINDLMELQNYCEKGNYEQVASYLNSTLGVVKHISKSSYDVGNDILNTILNYYLQPIKEKYIVEINGYIEENLSIEQRDLCTLSANLIKNAVEAVSKQEHGAIKINIEQGKQYLSIRISNTFDGKLDLDAKGVPHTLKLDKRNHGIGIQNVGQIVKKYEGMYHTEITDEIYCVEIYLRI